MIIFLYCSEFFFRCFYSLFGTFIFLLYSWSNKEIVFWGFITMFKTLELGFDGFFLFGLTEYYRLLVWCVLILGGVFCLMSFLFSLLSFFRTVVSFDGYIKIVCLLFFWLMRSFCISCLLTWNFFCILLGHFYVFLTSQLLKDLFFVPGFLSLYSMLLVTFFCFLFFSIVGGLLFYFTVFNYCLSHSVFGGFRRLVYLCVVLLCGLVLIPDILLHCGVFILTIVFVEGLILFCLFQRLVKKVVSI